MKEGWKNLERKKEKVTIVSIYAAAMYPSIKFPLAKKGSPFYKKNLLKHAMIKIDLFLRLIGFGMSSTFLIFKTSIKSMQRKVKKKGLAIGGYESAFLEDLVSSYLKNQFK